jgi:hypothetical protein
VRGPGFEVSGSGTASRNNRPSCSSSESFGVNKVIRKRTLDGCPRLTRSSNLRRIELCSVATYLLINYEYPPLGGGAATASRNLALALKRRGNRVVVLTSAYERLRGALDEDGVIVIRIPARRRSVYRSSLSQLAAYLLSACRHVVRAADCYQADRVIAFFSIPGGAVARWLQLRRSTPYIVSVRGGDVPGTEPKPRARNRRPFDRFETTF